jgi:hypothetical protein
MPSIASSVKVRHVTADRTSGRGSGRRRGGSRGGEGGIGREPCEPLRAALERAGLRHSHARVVMGVRIGHQVDRATVGEIHQHFVTLAGRDQEAGEFDRLRQQAVIACDCKERPPVRKAQVEVARIRGVEEAQPHNACGHLRYGIDDAVYDHGVADEAMHQIHHAGIVERRAVAIEALVLQHDRDVVDSVVRR